MQTYEEKITLLDMKAEISADEIMVASKKLIDKNREAYEVLAK